DLTPVAATDPSTGARDTALVDAMLLEAWTISRGARLGAIRAVGLDGHQQEQLARWDDVIALDERTGTVIVFRLHRISFLREIWAARTGQARRPGRVCPEVCRQSPPPQGLRRGLFRALP